MAPSVPLTAVSVVLPPGYGANRIRYPVIYFLHVAHDLVPTLRAAFARRPTFLGFFVGRRDVRFRDENVRLHVELRSARVPQVFRLYPGAHEQRLWEKHAPEWLVLALAHLSRPRW